MIKNGYYSPIEIFDSAVHFDEDFETLREMAHRDNLANKYDTLKLLKGDCAKIVSFGTRTGGKTVGFGRELLKRYERYKERSAICPRTIKQKDNGHLKKWWLKSLDVDDDEGYFIEFKKRHEIDFNKEHMFIDGDICSYSTPLSAAFQIKDEGSFKRCTKMIVDEAMRPGERHLRIEGQDAMYLANIIWQTMARGWRYAAHESSMIFIANSTERNNWVFNDLGVSKFWREDSKFIKRNGILIEKVDNQVAAKSLDMSVMGKVLDSTLSGKAYKDAAMNNTFGDNESFIMRKGLDFKFLVIQLVIASKTIGVFRNGEYFHIAEIKRDSRSEVICNNPMYHTEEVSFQPDHRWNELLQALYISDSLTFNDQMSKDLFLQYIGYM